MEEIHTNMNFSEMFELVGDVNRYFINETKKVFLTKEMETFEQYLAHRYKTSCYSYSFYALMGLKPDDFLLRGNIDINKTGYCSYHHGWVEFKYQEQEFIFDSLIKGIVTKDAWYETFKPRIDYKKTQKEILDEYLNEKNAYELRKGLWQFKYYIMNSDKSDFEIDYNEAREYSEKNGHVPGLLSLSRISLDEYSNRIYKFIN